MTITSKGNIGPAASSSTTTPPSVNTPFQWSVAPLAGDLNIGYVLNKPYSTVPYPPYGWEPIGTITSGTTASSGDAGSLALTLFYRIGNGAEPTSVNPTEYSGQYIPAFYGNHGFGKTAASWSIGAAFGADLDPSGTTVSVTTTAAPRFVVGDYGLVIFGLTRDDVTVSSPVLTIPGCTISALSLQDSVSTTTGDDMRFVSYLFSITSGLAIGPPTFTATTSISGYSAAPLAVVRVGEALALEQFAVSTTVSVGSIAGKRSAPRAKTTDTAAISPVALVEVGRARTSIVSFASPAATMAKAPAVPPVAGLLAIDVPTSAIMAAVSIATAASEGRTDSGVEMQVWNPANTELLAIVEGRMDMEWLDDMNDVGAGRFKMSRWDPKATPVNLALFNLVKFTYGGAVRFASRIETRHMMIVTSRDHAGQEWQIGGRGVLAMLDDAVLYPEYGITELLPETDRHFNFSSKEGAWYIASEWSPPQALPLSAVGEDHPWKGNPPEWPDPDAQWIWPTDPNQLAAPGPAWFRAYFDVTAPTPVTVYASGDDTPTVYLDGYLLGTVPTADNLGFKTFQPWQVKRLLPGRHLIAARVDNNDATLEEVKPVETFAQVTPSYASDSNRPYIGRGFTDGRYAYVNANGSFDGAGPGSVVFDDNDDTYWLSVGNYLGWTSAYEHVEGTFPTMNVTSVRVKVKGGPYTVYISLRNGGNNWNGGATIPYKHRVVDAHSDIRYVRQVRVDANADVPIDVDPQEADRVRVTLHATWDSGLGSYRWRGGLYTVQVTSFSRTGSYVRGGNFAGLLLSVASTDAGGTPTGWLLRSQSAGWLAKLSPEPGWQPPHIIMKMVEEAKERNVIGALPLSIGFTAYLDSYGQPWTMARKDTKYGIGTNYMAIIKTMTEAEQLDVWMDPATLMIHAAPRRGKDRTADIALRSGISLDELSIDSNKPAATRLVVQTKPPPGTNVWMEVGDFAAEIAIGRIEALATLGDATSVDEARAQAVEKLTQYAYPTFDAQVGHRETLGPRPYVDYVVGDLITLPTGFQQETSAYRVLSITMREDNAGNLRVILGTDLAAYALAGPGQGAPGSGATDDNGLPAGTVLTKLSAGAAPPYAGDVMTATTLTINTAGAVYTAYDLDRIVVVAAAGVSFVNCQFSGPATSAGIVEQALLTVNSAMSATATYCTFMPPTTSGGLMGAKGPGLTLVRCEIAMVTTAVKTDAGAVTVDNCWIHDMLGYEGSGEFGIVVTGGSSVVVNATRIDGAIDDAAIWVSQTYGANSISAVQITGCILGSDSPIGIFVYDDATVGAAPIANLQITNNIFEKGRQQIVMSVSDATLAAPTTAITGNVWGNGSIPPPTAIAGP